MNETDMNKIINNFKNILQNNDSTSTTNNSSTENPNTSTTENKSNLNISPEMLSNLLNNLKGPSSESEPSISNNSNNEGFPSNIDLDTILKIKSIMETLNKKDDPRSNLLYSLKPYLRESRQKKIDQYVNLFKITNVTNLFKNEKGDA